MSPSLFKYSAYLLSLSSVFFSSSSVFSIISKISNTSLAISEATISFILSVFSFIISIVLSSLYSAYCSSLYVISYIGFKVFLTQDCYLLRTMTYRHKAKQVLHCLHHILLHSFFSYQYQDSPLFLLSCLHTKYQVHFLL